jgi:chromosome segregation ATPase
MDRLNSDLSSASNKVKEL